MKDLFDQNLQRLRDIEKAIEAIEIYTKGQSFNIFCSNQMLHDAVLLQFVIIGEASVHLSNTITTAYKIHGIRLSVL